MNIWIGIQVLITVQLVRFAASEGYVRMPLKHNEADMYEIQEVSIGKRGRALKNVVFDTGSADFILTRTAYRFNLLTLGTRFSTQYGSTEAFSIFEAHLDIIGDDWKLQNATIGLTKESDIDSFAGVFGVGYPTIEAMDLYPNFPVKLVEDGTIDRWLYSFKGGDSNPSVVFGGIDQNAYEGPLVKTPVGYEIGPNTRRSYHNVLAVTVNSVQVVLGKLNSSVSDQRLIYTLDTGSNGLALPESVYKNIVALFEDVVLWQDDTAYFRYDSIKGASFVFDITGIKVSIPFEDVIDLCTNKGGSKSCSLRIATVQIGVNSYEATLPNSFFKYMYTVFDLESDLILMAPLKQQSKESVVAVSDEFPVPTTTAPQYLSTYESMYNSDLETRISASLLPTLNLCRRRSTTTKT